jgi:hypothetical protein
MHPGWDRALLELERGNAVVRESRLFMESSRGATNGLTAEVTGPYSAALRNTDRAYFVSPATHGDVRCGEGQRGGRSL